MNASNQILLAEQRKQTLRDISYTFVELYTEMENQIRQSIVDRLNVMYQENPMFQSEIPNIPIPLSIDAPYEETIASSILTGLELNPTVISVELYNDLFENLPNEPSFSWTIQETLTPDVSVEQIPFWLSDIQSGELHILGQMAALTTTQVEQLLELGINASTTTDEQLQTATEGDPPILAPSEAAELGRLLNFYHLFDNNLPLVDIFRNEAIPELGYYPANTIRELTVWDTSQWSAFFETNSLLLPPETYAVAYAEKIIRKVNLLYPTDMLFKRLAQVDPYQWESEITIIQPLFGSNPTPFPTPWDKLDLTSFQATELEGMQPAYESLLQLTRKYPGLALEEFLNDGGLTASQKSIDMDARIQLLFTLHGDNIDIELLAFDLTPDSIEAGLNLINLDQTQQEQALRVLRTYQRVYGITQDIEDASTLVEAGYTSAMSVLQHTSQDFVNQELLTGDMIVERTQLIYERAKEAANQSLSAGMAAFDAINGGFSDSAVSNLSDDITNFFKKIDNVEALFGSHNSCKCKQCQSLLSPAAYFVDLMDFVEEHVQNKHFSGVQSTHDLSLSVRRGDLWELPLTCENTHQMIPYLDIVNTIIENFIAVRIHSYTGDLSDRAAIEALVYDTHLSSTTSLQSFQRPFSLATWEANTFLKHFAYKRDEIVQAWEGPTDVLTQATLGLSQEEFDLITQSNTNLVFLQTLYNIPTQIPLADLDVQYLLSAMGMSRAELGEIIQTEYVTQNGSSPVQIVGVKKTPDSIQVDQELVQGLDTSVMDRMHRFTRLWNQIPWSIRELDEVLNQLTLSSHGFDLDVAQLEAIAKMQRFQRQLSLTVEELCVFWYQIPQTPMNEDSKSLVDRLFNPTRLTSSASDMWPNGDTFLYQNNPPTAADSLKQQRMLAGLQLTDDELGLLFQGLQPAIAYSSNDIQTNIQSLSVLTRHAQLAKMVDISIQELLALLTRVPNMTSSPITYLATFDDVIAFIDFVEVWKQSDVELETLAVIIDGVQAGSKWATQIAKEASTIVEQVIHEESLIFEDTVFAEIKGVTEFDSIAFVDLNPSLIERLPDQQCRLIYTYDPKQPQNHPIQIQTNLAGLETEFREILKRYDMVERLQEAIGNVWNVTAVDIWQCKNIGGVNLRTSNIFDDLHGTSGNAQSVAVLMESLFPMYTAFVDTKENINLLSYVYEVPLAFGISGSASTTLTAQQWLYTQTYKKYVEAYEETNTTAFKDILHDFVVSGYVFPQNQASLETLAQLFNTDTYIIKGMFDQSISLGVQPLEAFQKLEKNVTLAQSMGVNAELIVAINSSLSSDLRKASDGLWSSFRAKYADEKQWERLIEPFEDRVRSAKRDGLVAYMIQRPGATFESPTDIYRYLLLDPEMGDCARSSHVLSAISSLQLYVHRCLMNLEQDTQASIHVLPSDIPEGEWEWRKNYRLWEANRKVFLYPENYIEPGLRDNKSPLFQELEAKLLQNEVNEDTVTQAYAEYMRGFEEISQLSIAGTYHETDPQRTHDRLHLFGVSNHEPGTYYYRTADNLHSQEKAETRGVSWAPWRKLDVQIPSRKVSPIVFRGRLCLFWVELVTTPSYEEISGSPRFEGYHHTMSLKYIFQRLDSSWSTPQSVELDQVIPFINGTGVIPDMKTTSGSSPTTYSTKLHAEPQKGYTLRGYEWEQVFPHVLTDLSGDQEIAVTGRGFECESAPLDMYGQSIKQPKSTGLWKDTNNQVLCKPRMTRDKMLHQNGTKLYSGTPHLHYLDRYSFASILLDDNRLSDFKGKLQSQFNIFDPMFSQRCQKRHLLTVQTQPTDSMVINRAFANAIFDFDGDIILLQDTKRIEDKAVLYRLNTSLTERMGHKLFSQGVFALLDTDFQENGLSEKALPVTLTQYVTDKTYTGTLPTEGAMGIYFQEIFFHIPFLLADHLNKQGQYKDAQRWYHTIFNPTHEEAPGIQPGDRNWRYHKFRNQTMTTLRDILTNASTISAYKKDPFNPHAIARLRISAYQKSIVMKYIDNLLDWADALFTEDTTESLNEAMLLYVTAADILGKRPTELGECEALPESQMTYNSISKETKNGSTFLAEMEHLRKVPQPIRRPSTNTFSYTHTLTPSLWSDVNTQSTYLAPELAMEITGETTYTTDGSTVFHPDTSPEFGVYKGSSVLQEANTPTLFGKGIANQLLPVFCIPTNDDWIGYWDRVEDRMYKIRHCMNIKGVQRDLPLFAPQIDPALLAQAKTAGISTSELTNIVKGSLPPYRFAFIIEKAKEYASTVQSFGAALLGAVEKRDAEELEALRLVHEKNIQLLSRNTHDLEIKLAKEAITSAQQQQISANMRKLHYTQLIKKGLSNTEKTQASKAIEAFGFMQASNAFQNVASIAALVPDIGFATTIEYGGTQFSRHVNNIASAFQAHAGLLNAESSASALQANFERREQGWKFQQTLADIDVEQAKQQILVATIQKDLAQHAKKIFEESIKQLEEHRALFEKRFSGFGLYNWLVSQLQQLYREAFNSALSMARLAESAYRFERGQAPTIPVSASMWESGKIGLLSGERLLLQLQHMEREFMQSNYRKIEVDQSFSLAQLAPDALLALRQDGECSFSVPELAFDLFYPGHYHRMIKSARVTIPSVTGPYTNVSATLSLTNSKVRTQPNIVDALDNVQLSRTVGIATSTAQNDAGVFEFDFRDDRYMPFEGMGAISTWNMKLPKNFRPFDYNTINDVVLHISYTAKEDASLRSDVEHATQQLQNSILHTLQNTATPRLISFKQEFSNLYHRLQQEENQPISFILEDKFFPHLFQGKGMALQSAELVLLVDDGIDPTVQNSNNEVTTFKCNNLTVSSFTSGATSGPYPENYWYVDVTSAFGTDIRNLTHTLTLENAGILEKQGVPGIDETKLQDLFLYVTFKLS